MTQIVPLLRIRGTVPSPSGAARSQLTPIFKVDPIGWQIWYLEQNLLLYHEFNRRADEYAAAGKTVRANRTVMDLGFKAQLYAQTPSRSTTMPTPSLSASIGSCAPTWSAKFNARATRTSPRRTGSAFWWLSRGSRRRCGWS